MNRFKRYFSLAVITASLVSSYSINAYAKEMLELNRTKVDENTVSLKLENVEHIIKSFSLTVKLEGDVELDKVNFSKELEEKGKVNYKYDKEKKIINIYVTSKENLVSKNGTINIGTIDIKGKDGDIYNVSLNSITGKSIFKGVDNTEKKIEINEGKLTGDKEFVYGVESPGDSETPGKPETPENPGDNEVIPGNPDEETPGAPEKPSEPEVNPEDKEEQDKVEEDSNKDESSKNEDTNKEDNKNDSDKGNMPSSGYSAYIGLSALLIGVGTALVIKKKK
ncbi:hypothetical protein [Clostridium baratii]|uniref:LPXTG cell wall anchor domain-containing protein n=1 Tax=Clostridium baratii str. Sullivan TaxID=1415775 RepID=A0A0A7FXV8_9CLOT|nr:hypothetical protein [Clostridium baratii]AIY84413.1 hypothetical protein U729_621 [Clostridium baratii str. Sullivan]MDU4911030.1 hypothetical protein [Clostridium baratii]CUP50336.1 surface protein PspC [Clostridium baratii]